jgi:hypothetical protein
MVCARPDNQTLYEESKESVHGLVPQANEIVMNQCVICVIENIVL